MSPWITPPAGAPRPRAGSVAEAFAVLTGHRVTVLTGAGVSTDSGLPDYRSPGAPARHPVTFEQFIGDPRYRRYYWARNYVGWRHSITRVPNASHRAVAALERAGVSPGVVTQNVDLLHEQAGSRHVVDLHGRWDTVVCRRCGARHTRAELDQRLAELNPDFEQQVGAVGNVEIAPDADAVIERTETFRVRACWAPSPDGTTEHGNGFAAPGECGGMLKPDIVFFGETVPAWRHRAAAELIDEGDALLVVGSSLAVHSALRLVRRSVADGKPLVIVTRGGTRADDLAQVTIEAGAAETLSGLVLRLVATDRAR
ncbi:MAG: Sir2 family NAD-dependent protein deacetylase [Pseudoclavibacter sp.]